MEKRLISFFLIALGLSLLALPAAAQTTYGSQLMTPEERMQHRAMMRRLPPAEREAYRAQVHEQMKKKAEESGVTLPESPLPRGRNMRGGHGWGYPGMGPRFDAPYGWGPQDIAPYRYRGFRCPGRW